MPRSGADATDSVGSEAAAALARELLPLRTSAAVEERALAYVMRLARASWIALYRPREGAFCRSKWISQGGDAMAPEWLGEGASEAPIDELRVDSCRTEAESVRWGGAAFVVQIPAEFAARPIIMLIGPSDDGFSETPPEPIRAVAEVCGEALRNADLIDRLSSQVFVDFVTGLFNRRAFEEHLTVELDRARRYERPLSILLLDLDGFKEVNDSFGHAVGDQVLRSVGEILRAIFRTTDRVCRYGGDEFAVIFPETAKDDVLRLAERLRRRVAGINVNGERRSGITASIGVSSYLRDADGLAELVARADQALYRAKSEGRNQVTAA
jgi:diguanylate cyclase (GGDEF)-like protein